jgi:hypothetical protein
MWQILCKYLLPFFPGKGFSMSTHCSAPLWLEVTSLTGWVKLGEPKWNVKQKLGLSKAFEKHCMFLLSFFFFLSSE